MSAAAVAWEVETAEAEIIQFPLTQIDEGDEGVGDITQQVTVFERHQLRVMAVNEAYDPLSIESIILDCKTLGDHENIPALVLLLNRTEGGKAIIAKNGWQNILMEV